MINSLLQRHHIYQEYIIHLIIVSYLESEKGRGSIEPPPLPQRALTFNYIMYQNVREYQSHCMAYSISQSKPFAFGSIGLFIYSVFNGLERLVFHLSISLTSHIPVYLAGAQHLPGHQLVEIVYINNCTYPGCLSGHQSQLKLT